MQKRTCPAYATAEIKFFLGMTGAGAVLAFAVSLFCLLLLFPVIETMTDTEVVPLVGPAIGILIGVIYEKLSENSPGGWFFYRGSTLLRNALVCRLLPFLPGLMTWLWRSKGCPPPPAIHAVIEP